MTNLLAAALFILVLAAVVVLLDHAHRRTDDLPHAPSGADAGADVDLQRVLHDLDARP